jgi:L-asparaginase
VTPWSWPYPGGGHIANTTPALLEALPMPVVFASRTGAGETLTHSYGYAGGEIDLIARGLIPASPLAARSARIALDILLSNKAIKKDIAAFFGGL